jgi:hypothetical protein
MSPYRQSRPSRLGKQTSLGPAHRYHEPYQGVRQEEVNEGQDEEPASHSRVSCFPFFFSFGALVNGDTGEGRWGRLPVRMSFTGIICTR